MVTEKRMIYANEAKKIAKKYLSNPYEIISTCAVLDRTPTVDSVEVVHGQWVFEPVEFTYEKDIKCSACGEYVDHATNYCPNCGAKMDGTIKN